MKTKKINQKIIVVSQFWPPNFVGGGEISTYYTCKQLAAMGYEISIMTPNPSHDRRFKFIRLTNPQPFLTSFEEKYFQSITTNQKLPQGVYWASDFYGAAFLKNINAKKIATVRDYWPICGFSQAILRDYSFCPGCNLKNLIRCRKIKESNFLQKAIRMVKYLHNRSFRKSILPQFNHVVFISQHLAKRITAQIPLKSYSVIYNSLSQEQEYISKRTSKSKINNKILFAGTVSEYKGISILIKAMKKVVANNQEIVLLIAGAGNINQYQKLTKKLALSQNIRFLNKLPYNKVIDYYNQCDAVVAPSLRPEPFGRTIIEGMARKCLPIATNQGGPREIIKNEKTGFLFERGNHEQLAQLILNLYQYPEKMKKIQAEARKFAVKTFSPEIIAKKYKKIFEKFKVEDS